MNRTIPALALAVGAACAAPAFADTVEVYTLPTGADYYYVAPTTDAYYVAPRTYYYTEPATTYYTEPATTYYYAQPTTTYVYTEPPITVEAERNANQDVAINNDVMDSIAMDPRITGNIGVQTYRNQVELTGRVSTPGQRDRAGMLARSVDGVDEVTNLIKPRVGNF